MFNFKYLFTVTVARALLPSSLYAQSAEQRGLEIAQAAGA